MISTPTIRGGTNIRVNMPRTINRMAASLEMRLTTTTNRASPSDCTNARSSNPPFSHPHGYICLFVRLDCISIPLTNINIPTINIASAAMPFIEGM